MKEARSLFCAIVIKRGFCYGHIMNTKNLFSIKECYTQAWIAFSKWWIPLCLLSGIIFLFGWLPKLFVRVESAQITSSIVEFINILQQGSADEVAFAIAQTNDLIFIYVIKLLRLSLYILPVVALLTVVLYGISIMAVNNRRIRYSFATIVKVTFFQFIIAPVKILLLFFVFPLGVFIYIKLFFVTFLMLEQNRSFGKAIKESWAMTTGYFWSLVGVVCINSVLQVGMGLTVIGIIPCNGFTSTVRAIAFKGLQQDPTLSEEE